MTNHTPEHDTHYGEIDTEPPVELRGVGEFHPESAAPDIPVFEARTANGSFLVFCFLPDEVDEAYMRVFQAGSVVSGEFSFLMDTVIRWFGGETIKPREVVFTNVVTEWLRGEDLDEKLRGFESRTVEIPEGQPHAGEEVEELVGEWDAT